MPDGRIVFVELKTEVGVLSKAQIRMISKLRSMNVDVRVVYGYEDGVRLLDELLPPALTSLPAKREGDDGL